MMRDGNAKPLGVLRPSSRRNVIVSIGYQKAGIDRTLVDFRELRPSIFSHDATAFVIYVIDKYLFRRGNSGLNHSVIDGIAAVI